MTMMMATAMMAQMLMMKHLAVVVRAGLVVHRLLRVNIGHSADGAVVLRLGIRTRHVCWALDHLLKGQPFL